MCGLERIGWRGGMARLGGCGCGGVAVGAKQPSHTHSHSHSASLTPLICTRIRCVTHNASHTCTPSTVPSLGTALLYLLHTIEQGEVTA